jgi:hypothetical protein
MTPKDVMLHYRQKLGKETRPFSFQKMARDIGHYYPVGINTLYRWTTTDTVPERWKHLRQLEREADGWVKAWATDMINAIDDVQGGKNGN